MRYLSLAVAFLLELAVLAAVGYFGFTRPVAGVLRVVVGIGAPLLMAALWGLFAAPNASVRLHGAVDAAFQLGWFGIGVLALAVTDRSAAVTLAAVYVLNSLVLLATKPS